MAVYENEGVPIIVDARVDLRQIAYALDLTLVFSKDGVKFHTGGVAIEPG